MAPVKLYGTRLRPHLAWLLAALLLLAALFFAGGCGALAPLGRLVQPPHFEEADGHPAELRLLGPAAGRPAGGAAVRIWLEVSNPNPFGFTLSTLTTTLLLEGTRAATGDFPLGLPLAAGQQSVVPLDVTISFGDLPSLADTLRQAALGAPVDYELDGTVGIDAGQFGRPTFGPMRLTAGELRVIR